LVGGTDLDAIEPSVVCLR